MKRSILVLCLVATGTFLLTSGAACFNGVEVVAHSQDSKTAKSEDGSKPQRLGPYELNKEGYIINWLVIGPFPNPGDRPDNAGFDVDYLKGESKHLPSNKLEVTKQDGSKAKWSPYSSPDAEINFFQIKHLNLSDQQEDILVYAACWLECEKDSDIEIRIGSDDGYKLWIDNKEVAVVHEYRSAQPDQETYPMKLSKGMHLVLIKVDQDYGEFLFMMRAVTKDGNRATGIKVWN